MKSVTRKQLRLVVGVMALGLGLCIGVGTVWAVTDIQTGDPGGGAASASAVGSDADNTAIATGGAGAEGGPGGGASAIAATDTSAPAGATATAEATGGTGGNAFNIGVVENGGSGGAAEASAVGTNATGRLSVRAQAVGGTGGNGYNNGGAAGEAAAHAHGVSLNGEEVVVEAIQTGGSGGWANPYGYGNSGNGAASVMIDAVSGSTSGLLTLRQTASGGNGGGVVDPGGPPGRPGMGGMASSSLMAANDAEGAIIGFSIANGGEGGSGYHAGQRGGDASAFIALLADGDVDATAIANGGVGGTAADGGAATLEEAYGRSLGGGRVSVTGEANGGGYGPEFLGIGEGASVMLTNRVDGDTSAELVLRQIARPGRSGYASPAGVPAESHLWLTKDCQRFEGEAVAEGGDMYVGWSVPIRFGGEAVASCVLSNVSGGCRATASATGGACSFTPAQNGPANATASATAPQGQLASASAFADGYLPLATSSAERQGKIGTVLTAQAKLEGLGLPEENQGAAEAHAVVGPESEPITITGGDYAAISVISFSPAEGETAIAVPEIPLPPEFTPEKPYSTIYLGQARLRGNGQQGKLHYRFTQDTSTKLFGAFQDLKLALFRVNGPAVWACEVTVRVEGVVVYEENLALDESAALSIDQMLIDLGQIRKRAISDKALTVEVEVVVSVDGSFSADLVLVAQR